MTRGYTTWYKCLFCTRVYPLPHQLVEHRRINHAEQWKEKKLARKLAKMQAEKLKEEILDNKGKHDNNTDEEEIEKLKEGNTTSNESMENGNSDTASNSTVILTDTQNASDAETEYSNDDETEEVEKGECETQMETEATSEDLDNPVEEKSLFNDCSVVFRNSIQKELEVKITPCDRDLIRIKSEVELLESEDNEETEDNIDDIITSNDTVSTAECVKESIIDPPIEQIRKEKVFTLFKCDHCSKQFLHKWGLKLHKESAHVQKGRGRKKRIMKKNTFKCR